MNRNEILFYLKQLDKKLIKSNIKASLYVCGGAAMAISYNSDRRTDDIDALFKPDNIIRDLAQEVAEENNLDKNWLNSDAYTLIEEKHFRDTERLAGFINLNIYIASPNYMLALKCLAVSSSRSKISKDMEDIIILLEKSDINSINELKEIIGKYYDLLILRESLFDSIKLRMNFRD